MYRTAVLPLAATMSKSLPATAYLKNMSMVFQNVYLFRDTIENNIKFGFPEATHEQVVEPRKKPAATILSLLCHKDMTR